MGIRMLHRRKAHARVLATSAAGPRSWPRAASRTRPRPALAPGAAVPRIPWAPGPALRAAAARLRGPAPGRWRPRSLPGLLSRSLHRLLPGALSRFLAGFVPRDDSRRLVWAEAVRGHLGLALGVLGRLRGPRSVRRIPLYVAPAIPFTERPDDSAAR
ncbi:hypothetical protein J2X68_004941 [Streptomyces sp. 3330]|uniref:hypothetical protein n=1 Tax=Streptomyces sp. 3330 TaxID=2817755 RepID=UPI002862862D|nr:hypothetical protein [Streptomyces sp. 3330]MDR6978216.1 hypothetical protein [Streptomyces sp. 3330]